MYVRMRHPPSHKTFRMSSQINVTIRPAAHGPWQNPCGAWNPGSNIM